MHDRLKTIVIGEKEFVIEKFDAMTALKLARFLLSKLAPLLPALLKEEGEMNDYLLYELIGEALAAVDDGELEMLVRHCLRACSVNLPAGRQRVMDEFGNYGVEGVEHDAALVVRLCVQALLFGAADFFSGNAPLSRWMASRLSRRSP